MDDRTRQGKRWLWSLPPVAVSLGIAFVFRLASWGYFLFQAFFLALGIALGWGAAVLSRRLGARWLQWVPLALLLLPLGLTVWELLYPHGFLGGFIAALFQYLLPGLHYLLGWLAVCLSVRRAA